MTEKRLVIVGAGPAGLAAAVAAYDAGERDILVLERDTKTGGILNQCIHNGFGLHYFGEELTGPEYADRFGKMARERGIEIHLGTMVLDITDRIVTCVSGDRGLEHIKAGAVILAMGCRERPRGALGTPGTRCSGIYSAGTAQKLVNLDAVLPGKRVVILGSGDIGLIMARRMTFEGAKVLACVEIMPYSGGLKRNIVQCLDDYGIPLMLSHTVTNIIGKERLEAVVISEVDEKRNPIPGTEQTIECDTLLLSCGLLPENELTRAAGIEIDRSTSGALVDNDLATTQEGVFACGNVLHVHDLVDYVSNESAAAGRAAAAYLNGKKSSGKTIPVVRGFGANGVVPQRVNVGSEDVNFMFRPANPYRKAYVVIKSGENELHRSMHQVLAPGEMVSITVKADKMALADGEITVFVEPKEETK